MAKNWEILGQRHGSEIRADGAFVDVMEITVATIPKGTTTVIKVPISQYNADRVSELIEDRVAQILAVENL